MRFRCQGPSLVVDTPAKLNLFLDVRGKRPDGYHELETLMVSIGLFDTLRFSPRSDGRVSLETQSLPAGTESLSSGPDNLIVRAALLLAEEAGCKAGVTMTLQKRIPLQSGMGGGSSDAAATLVGLNRFWRSGLSMDALHRLASRLGSDINFFLGSSPLAVCRGRGEQIEQTRLGTPLHFVLAKPASGLSTADVFRTWRASSSTQDPAQLLTSLRTGRVHAIGKQLHNALQTPAAELSSDVRDALQRLRRHPFLGTAMTGSGSTCFGLCASRAQARSIGGALRAAGPMRIWVASTSV